MSQGSLLFSRRFGPIFVSMALGAFNDNFYKNAIIILITYLLADRMHARAEVLISVASAFFILPFFLFSGVAGLIADRYAKHGLVLAFKLTELVLCVLAGIALMTQQLAALFAILFLFGTQSAFFGPVKYAILPELLKKDELLAGNGLIEAGTFLCILGGTLAGGLLVLKPHGVELVGLSLVFFGLLGVYSALKVPVTAATSPTLALSGNIVTTTVAMLRYAVSKPAIWFAILGISWFWAIGVTYLTQIPVFAKEVVGGNEEVASFYLGLFSVGIGAGAVYCQRIQRTAADLAPKALLAVGLFGLHLVWLSANITRPDALFGMADYFTGWRHAWLALDLFGLAAAGGVFIVPLYTQLQLKSEEDQRARAIASNNVMNALFSSVAAVLAMALYGAGMQVQGVLLTFTALNIPVIYYLNRHRQRAR